MINLLNRFFAPDISTRLKKDYLQLQKLDLVYYDGLWCLKENDCLLLLEEKGIGG